MAVGMTYNSLFDAIKTYLERSDATLLSYIPTFIMLAEQRLAREFGGLGFTRPVTSTMDTNSSGIIAKPARWRATTSFNIGTGTGYNTRVMLLPRTYEFLRSYNPDPTVTGQPKYYADYDFQHWLVSPAPDLAYPFEVVVQEYLEPVSTDNQTNWLTDYCPDLFLYGCLLESAPYLKDDERIAMWQERYDRALKAEIQLGQKRLVDRYSEAR